MTDDDAWYLRWRALREGLRMMDAFMRPRRSPSGTTYTDGYMDALATVYETMRDGEPAETRTTTDETEDKCTE